MSLWVAIVGLAAAIVAAAVHGLIFVLESLLFDQPTVRRMFGVRREDASRPLLLFAVNQGIYNLALAITVCVGIIVTAAVSLPMGLAVISAPLAIMVVAAIALAITSPRAWPFALVQGVPAAIGLACCAVVLLGPPL